ncbi:hypothetical protein EC844_1069 [Acinetobacter calcoaceticus]|uniref:HutD family protein n=1 Tax=Acinetobacter calcoaceticus TaxID=471 RepID=A0A4R1XU89_ACICA|nr:hypothetical protein EC844_1069 [Acinetobacter calcoaceticus]
MIQHLKPHDYLSMPWKNGAGTTMEIARDQQQGLDQIGWRLSIADVQQSGGFSVFQGLQRIISVLKGQGFRLSVDGQLMPDLTPHSAYAFSGDAAVYCELIQDPIQDFNLIYDPLQFKARLQWLAINTPQQLYTDADVIFIFNASEQLQLHIGTQAYCLSEYDCVRIEKETGLQYISLASTISSRCCIVELVAI